MKIVLPGRISSLDFIEALVTYSPHTSHLPHKKVHVDDRNDPPSVCRRCGSAACLSSRARRSTFAVVLEYAGIFTYERHTAKAKPKEDTYTALVSLYTSLGSRAVKSLKTRCGCRMC